MPLFQVISEAKAFLNGRAMPWQIGGFLVWLLPPLKPARTSSVLWVVVLLFIKVVALAVIF